ncbi:unnamed protein product [Urochloa humidicola]
MGSSEENTGNGRGGVVRGAVLKALVVGGSVLLLRSLCHSTTRWDHVRAIACCWFGVQFSREQSWILATTLQLEDQPSRTSARLRSLPRGTDPAKIQRPAVRLV